jgi:hypothetical protein
MLRFHTNLQAEPAGVMPGEPLQLGPIAVRPIRLPQPQTRPAWGLTFDEAAERLIHLPRFFYEPDGSFVWFATTGAPTWRLEGNLYDRGDELAFVELKGTCPAAEFDELLAIFRTPDVRLLFQLPRLGLYLDEPDFRQLAATAAGAV